MKIEDFEQVLKNPKVFCEIGVYFYDEYCRLKKQIEEGKQVILVEPAPPCVEDIRKNCQDKPNVKLWDCAIGNENGQTTIYFEGASAFISEIDGKAPVHQRNYLRDGIPTFVVPKATFNNLDPGDIDVLLIDTEGMEYFVLKYLISRPQAIVIETHYSGYTNPYINEINNWMKENGYKAFSSDESDTCYLRYDY